MSAENEAYHEGQQLLRRLRELERRCQEIDASDTACKTRVLALIAESRQRLEAALRELAGIV